MKYLIAIILFSIYALTLQSCLKQMPVEGKKVVYVVCRVDSGYVDTIKYSFKPILKSIK